MVAFQQSRVDSAFALKQKLPVTDVVAHIRTYFEQHPEVAREEFLLGAVEKELNFREQREVHHRTKNTYRASNGPATRPFNQLMPTAEDIHLHALLAQRQALLHDKRRGLWGKIRRFLAEL